MLITGCGLGATHYTARLLRACGLDVGHERVKSDGAVSFGHATWVDPVAVERGLTCGRAQWCFGGGPSSADAFALVLRQMRNPRKVATGIGQTATSDTWAKLLRPLEIKFDVSVPWPPQGDDLQRMEAGVAYTYWWYIYAGLHADLTYRVEDMPHVLPRILAMAGHDVPRQRQREALEEVSTTAGSRQKDRGYDYWTWDQIEQVRWGRELRALARTFGYDNRSG